MPDISECHGNKHQSRYCLLRSFLADTGYRKLLPSRIDRWDSYLKIDHIWVVTFDSFIYHFLVHKSLFQGWVWIHARWQQLQFPSFSRLTRRTCSFHGFLTQIQVSRIDLIPAFFGGFVKEFLQEESTSFSLISKVGTSRHYYAWLFSRVSPNSITFILNNNLANDPVLHRPIVYPCDTSGRNRWMSTK